MALVAVTLLVTSPFLYCFSRLAILEPLLIALMLAALNLAVRLPRYRHPLLVSAGIGLLFTLMMLTKTTAVFLLPALGWAMLQPLKQKRKQEVRYALAAAGAFAVSFGLWMALIKGMGLLGDFRYLFFVNKYPKPRGYYWPMVSAWWSFHGGEWVDHLLIPLAGLVVLGAVIAWRRAWGRKLLLDPVFGPSILAVAGYILFMAYQDHPQPRYFVVVAFFSFFLLAQGVEALLSYTTATGAKPTRLLGCGVVALAALAVGINGAWVMDYAAHPEYTFVNAAERLTRYIDEHPNGKRLLVSSSGDEITLVTHLPSLCDDFGTQDLVSKLATYQPGWFASWNDLDPGTLEDLHSRYWLEQVASFHTFDDPERNRLVLFKLHPLPGGRVRQIDEQNLDVILPDDKIDVMVE
jgi:hypothetical protein